MIIDLAFLGMMVLAIFKGLQKGLIVAVFSLVAFIVGLAAAIKLSAVVAVYLKDSVNVSAQWLPVLSFLAVFIAVVVLIRMAAKLIEASVEVAMMGWANKIGGAFFYMVLYTILLSVALFFLVQLNIISEKTIKESVTYDYIQPWGPFVIDGIGKWIPVFKDLFTQLEDFFGNLSQKIQH